MGKGLSRSVQRGSPAVQEIFKQTFLVKAVPISIFANAAAIGFGTAVVGDFPQGNILFLGAVSYLTFAGTGSDANLVDTWTGSFSLGTAPTADLTLSGAEIDLIPVTTITAATAEISPRLRAVNAVQAMFDNTDDSLEINLNALIDAASITDGATVNLTVTGEITVLYSILSDD